jgi:capsular exopolysaccharide synthesis family protein
MGRFYEALRRSGTLKEQGSSNPPPSSAATISTDTTDGFLPDPTPMEIPTGEQPVAVTADHPASVIEEHPTSVTADHPASVFGIDPRLSSYHNPSSPEAECFRMLRTKLLVFAREKPLRSILVTSPQPLDGKSLVTANLAVSIAQGLNDYVLLVDCDLRAPALNRIFNVNTPSGIHEYLKEGTHVAPFLVKTPLQKLTLLPGGTTPPNPAELLCSQKMRILIQELRSRYEDRFVIFDSPPGRYAAETAFLARMMDGVLLVARYGKTPRHLITETLENIGRERVLGVVFNATGEGQKEYQYYYGNY